ncbi:zinc finger protein 106 isoform X2 [Latimeria chalumnae]|uniref:zinc finger protein 106 isoform X2 n=1 Tax=Latimeria chalumnae TaxID=7897 RepID=UPI0006D8E70E|nr:PREDICTED: zinc finger protein 106 [Latimeria chalumnae]|eukprot:XP_014349129.1 PREDICTED: zinc finger protein 106 [Latimeria chalumnae]
MAKERKCILCHIVYTSRKEMDEHMRSMLHHRELENLKGRDCDHECRVCGVTVVGLTAYAKHISSQLHKDKISAGDGKEEPEQEYFDKELVQLIKQRNKAAREEESCNYNGDKEPVNRRQQGRFDSEVNYQDGNNYNQPPWHQKRERNWENDSYPNHRQGSFPFPREPANPNWRSGIPRGPPGWHPNGPGGAQLWHHNHGGSSGFKHPRHGLGSGPPVWHTGRNPGRHPEGQEMFSNLFSSNSGGVWNSNSRGSTGKNPGGGFSLRKNHPLMPNSTGEDLSMMWNSNPGKSKNYNQDRYKWDVKKKDNGSKMVGQRGQPADRNDHLEFSMDFTSDSFSSEDALFFSKSQIFDSNTEKMFQKSMNPSREKGYRWAPYPSQRSQEYPPGSNDGSCKILQPTDPFYLFSPAPTVKIRSNTMGKLDSTAKLQETREFAKTSACTKEKPGKDGIKGSRTPQLKSVLSPTPNTKSLLRCEGFLKTSKPHFSTASSKGRTPLNALNLETNTVSSYFKKLHSMAPRSLQSNKSASSNESKGLAELSLSEELRRAREILQRSRCESKPENSPKSTESSFQENLHTFECSMESPVDSGKLQQDALEVASHGSNLSTNENKKLEGQVASVGTSDNECCEYVPSELENATQPESSSIPLPPCRDFEDPSSAAVNTKSKESDMESMASPSVNGDSNSKTSLEINSAGNGDVLKADDFAPTEGCENSVLDSELQRGGGQPSGPLLPELSKLGLPASLQRDLTRHITAKSKASSGHLPEPNLNNARRIRNISGHRKSESEKESGLKPTVKHLLNVSCRNINWDQVIQQATKKKQELGKGLPRFGIEMVPQVQTEQEVLEPDEDPDLPSLEGFHWEGITVTAPPGSARKRSLSESSVVGDRNSSVYSLFADQDAAVTDSVEADKEEESEVPSIPASQEAWNSIGPNVNDHFNVSFIKRELSSPSTAPRTSSHMLETAQTRRDSLPSIPDNPVGAVPLIKKEDFNFSNPTESSVTPVAALTQSQNALETGGELKASAQGSTTVVRAFSLVDGATDSSYTSGAEQNDSQGLGKKRRAAADGSSPEVPSLERKNKRRKIKCKKERSQVDQLLSISLREEELNKSLQGVDGSLVQARAALQAAYLDVQRLLVLKQQVTMEMSNLRTQRIQILQGLQETLDSPERPEQELLSSTPVESRATTLISTPFSSLTITPANHTSHPVSFAALPLLNTTLSPLQKLGGLPTPATASAIPDSSIQIKQEPVSPGRKEEGMNVSTVDFSTDSPASSSLYTTAVEPPLLPDQANGGVTPESSMHPVITAVASLSGLLEEFQERDPVESPAGLASGSKGAAPKSTSPVQSQMPVNIMNSFAVPERPHACFPVQALKLHSTPEVDPSPLASLPEAVESSLACGEGKVGKKKKKLRKKKSLKAASIPENSDTEQDVGVVRPVRKQKNKKSPKGGTVTTSTPQEFEEATNDQEAERPGAANELGSMESDSDLEVVEIPNPPCEVVAINSSDSGNEKPDSPSKRDFTNFTGCPPEEIPRSGCDEVSSTSELGTNYGNSAIRSVPQTQTPLSSRRGSKNSSELSSEPGEDEEPSEGSFEGHQAAINAMQIYNGLLYTCSADKTTRAYSLISRKCVGVFEGHSSKVNCLLISQMPDKKVWLYTGSSDHTIRCHSIKTKECLEQLMLPDRVLCLHSRWRILFVGLANGSVVTFSLKDNKQLDVFECHGPRAVSCLATGQEGARKLLLVGSYDCTISVRDARNGLLLRTLEGHTKTVLCMKVVNDLVFSGSSDQSVHAHNIHTGELVRIYKGHSHAVTVVTILGKVMVTACLDKLVRIYELQSHDRLQVYGGHSDMIMCMVIHKSMIYTGCYDGSVQAVRLNLMQNFRCWWHGCSMIFGVMDHLKHHLLTDHTNPNFQTLKCRWRNCDSFFTAKKGSKQNATKHLQKHAEEDSRVDS